MRKHNHHPLVFSLDLYTSYWPIGRGRFRERQVRRHRCGRQRRCALSPHTSRSSSPSRHVTSDSRMPCLWRMLPMQRTLRSGSKVPNGSSSVCVLPYTRNAMSCNHAPSVRLYACLSACLPAGLPVSSARTLRRKERRKGEERQGSVCHTFRPLPVYCCVCVSQPPPLSPAKRERDRERERERERQTGRHREKF